MSLNREAALWISRELKLKTFPLCRWCKKVAKGRYTADCPVNSIESMRRIKDCEKYESK